MDYPDTLTVSVSAAHIASGIPFDCGCCPIALAICTLGYASAYVGLPLVNIDGKDYVMGADACEFVRRFDDRMFVVEPCEVTLTRVELEAA